MDDPRRDLPRTDDVCAHPSVLPYTSDLHPDIVRHLVRAQLDQARGRLTPGASPTAGSGTSAPTVDDIAGQVAQRLGELSGRRERTVLNATGVVVHTNLGRAPLGKPASAAVVAATSYTDVEFDLDTGQRSARGKATKDAVLMRLPGAQAALVVNNCASALMLVAAHFAAIGPIVLSRGEFVEIGAGFRLHELMESVGARFSAVGATNRTHLSDYRRALETGQTAAILKIHPSNYRQDGFTSDVSTRELAALAREFSVPLIVDIGSGLLAPMAELPHEPNARTTLDDGADLVLFSGDKLLGGPQAGVVVGVESLVSALEKHPLFRAVRPDKTTLAALRATVLTSDTPVQAFIRATDQTLRDRCERVVAKVREELRAEGPREVPAGGAEVGVVPHTGHVGGGGGTGVELPGFAIGITGVPAAALAHALRTGENPLVPHVANGMCYIDVRCIDPQQDWLVRDCIIAALRRLERPERPDQQSRQSPNQQSPNQQSQP